MSTSLHIAIADDEPDMCDYFLDVLPRLGHTVVGVARNGRELVEQCRATQPELVITDINMPELKGIEAAAQIFAHRPVPIILVSAYHDPVMIERAELAHIMGYLVKPIKQGDLAPTIAIAQTCFARFQARHRKAADRR